MTAAKKVRNVVFAAAALTATLVIIAMVYTLAGEHTYTEPTPASTVDEQAEQLTPKAPSPSAAEGVAIETLSNPVKPGGVASLIAHTNPGSTCTVVIANSLIALKQQTADVYGVVAWQWSADTRVGSYSTTVTCAYHGRTGVVRDDFIVQ